MISRSRRLRRHAGRGQQELRASYKGSYGFREKIDIEGLDHPKRMFDLTEGLVRRKYTDRQIEGILGATSGAC